MITLTFAEARRPRTVVPPGWGLLATRLVPPGGGEPVEIRQMADGGAEPLEARAAREGARLAERLPGYTEQSLDRRSTRAGDVLQRTFAWERDDQLHHEVQIMGAGGALATLPADQADSGDVLATVAEAVAAFAFGAPEGLSGAYSIEELTALAELAGTSSFPGTGDHAFASDESRQAARRALLARGTLRGGPDGALEMDSLDRRMVDTALNPAAVLRIAAGRADALERCLIYTGNGVSVAHSAGAHGVHRLEAVPSALLGAMVRALTRPGTESAAPGGARTVSADELRALEQTASTTSVEVVAAGADTGEALSWLEREEGLGLVLRNGESARFTPASRAQIDELLEALCAPLSGRGAEIDE